MGPFLRFLLGIFLLIWSVVGVVVLAGSIFIATHIGSAVNQLSTKIESGVGDLSKNFGAPGDGSGNGNGTGSMNNVQPNQSKSLTPTGKNNGR